MKDIKKPYSYHTFFFPFLWYNGRKKLTRKTFTKCLNSDNWIFEDLSDVSVSRTDGLYNQYHYFNAAARNAIYSGSENDAVVWNYRFNMPGSAGNKSKYVIRKDSSVINLPINSIRLKLFNTGIGIIIFELENYEYADVASINRINDYGRRIYMPYSDGGDCGSCADEISLVYGDTVITTGKLTGRPETFRSTRIAEPLLYLLQNGKYSVTTDEKKADRHTFLIEPVIDDRMFVACYCTNKEFTDSISEWKDGKYGYMYDAETKKPGDDNNRAAALYKMMFVDGSFLTCRSRHMLAEMLGKKHIYDRWIEMGGNVIGITEYSMINVTAGVDGDDFLARNFLTEYVEMIILTLAQRATLLAFERMISDSALGKQNIKEIHKSYLLFQSQLLLKEVTPQQQGIELYRMLLDNMFIFEQTAEIEKQINSLFVQKTANYESSENRILFIIAILGIFDVTEIIFNWICPLADGIFKFGLAFPLSILILIWSIIRRFK